MIEKLSGETLPRYVERQHRRSLGFDGSPIKVCSGVASRNGMRGKELNRQQPGRHRPRRFPSDSRIVARLQGESKDVVQRIWMSFNGRLRRRPAVLMALVDGADVESFFR